MNYYLVTTKCGHVGKSYYIPITFPIIAEDGKEAARIARNKPRVKHDHWDAILSCISVDEETYNKQIEINRDDPYLHVGSRHAQNALIDQIKHRLVRDNHQNELVSYRHRKGTKPNLFFQAKKYQCNSCEYMAC